MVKKYITGFKFIKIKKTFLFINNLTRNLGFKVL